MMNEISRTDNLFKKLIRPQEAVKNITYRPSQYVLTFCHEGKSYAAHTLTKQCIEGTVPASYIAGGEYDGLIGSWFLVPGDLDECEWYLEVLREMRSYSCLHNPAQPSYVILPTSGCNARCTYCFEEETPVRVMTDQTADCTAEYIRKTCFGRPVSLKWFGGEPLMCPGTIDRICHGLQTGGNLYISHIVTNGSLITPDIICRMKELWKANSVQVAMDGAEEDYVNKKRYLREQDQYHKVLEAIGQMAQAGIRVIVRCNADRDNIDTIPAFLHDLQAAVVNKVMVSLYFSPLYGISRSEAKYNLDLWKRILSAGELAKQAHFRVMINGISVKKLGLWHCMADQGDVLIDPDGALYCCDSMGEKTRFGTIFQEKTDLETRNSFCRSDLVQEKCRFCPFLPECTPFSNCPVRDEPCREVKELLYRSALKELLR